jgi:hypothetical protein
MVALVDVIKAVKSDHSLTGRQARDLLLGEWRMGSSRQSRQDEGGRNRRKFVDHVRA